MDAEGSKHIVLGMVRKLTPEFLALVDTAFGQIKIQNQGLTV